MACMWYNRAMVRAGALHFMDKRWISMTEERYRAVSAWFRARPGALAVLKWANRLLPAVVYLSYVLMLGALLLGRDGRFWRALEVPAVVFVCGTWMRAKLNWARPYEVYQMAPLTPKDRAGQSFPSRHLFSAAVIAMCGLWLWPPVGCALWAVTLLLAPARVLAGVHFVRDVAAGIIFGGGMGWLAYYVLFA